LVLRFTSGTALAKAVGEHQLKTELIMNKIIDLNSEVLIDRSLIRNPYLRLLLAAIGEELAVGSAWVAVDKKIASEYAILIQLIARQAQYAAA
jgi:hypothetical protein